MAKRLMRLVVAVTVFGTLLAIGGRAADAQTVATITTDAPQYLPGSTVTFTGTGWGACEFDIPVRLVRLPLDQFLGLFTPADGTFSGTLTAPTPLGTYTLTAVGDQEGCDAVTQFDVVEVLPTTTTTTTTTTTSTGSSASSMPTTTSSATRSTALARTGANPLLLIAAGVAIAVGLLLVAGSRRRSVS